MAPQALVATRKGLFPLFDDGRAWRLGAPSFLGDPVTMALADPRDGALYAALALGHFGVKLRRSRDAGVTWEEVAAPAYPPQEEAPAEDKTPWKLAQIWSLETGGADEPAGTLWAGTIPGGLFRSEDGGESWSLVRSLWDRRERLEWFGGGYDHPGIHSILVDPRSSAVVTAAISCGGVWQTRDRGASWALRASGMRADYMPPDRGGDPNIQDAHRVVQCRAAPEVLWAQHHSNIFRSVDGGAEWRAVEGEALSRFGFAVAAHPEDPDTAWFVPATKDACRVPVDARLAVTRTRDGGRSFETLRDGLPQAHCYDIVYRHALDVDAGGVRLLLGSTTGSLWASRDAGETWQTLAWHLPPIACVRFI
jgi:hypothetical protein